MIDSPEFRALNREASLATQTVCAGLTALRKADAAKTGVYNEAFFNLSIGIERLVKLAIVIDHCLDNSGKFPNDKALRNYGHELNALVKKAREIRSKYPTPNPLAQFPNDEIVPAIVECLSDFAKGARYYNLDYLVAGKSVRQGWQDPIAMWAERVGKPLLAKHYTKRQREKDARIASELGALMDEFSLIRFTAEDGSPITDAGAMLAHSGSTQVVQNWGQLYTLRLVRFLAMLLMDLHLKSVNMRLEFVPWLSEYLGMFHNEDKYFKSRKTWKIGR